VSRAEAAGESAEAFERDHDLVPVGTPIDLDNCAREPIHVPGSIQPRGVLLVVREPDLRVTQVSANVAELLGLDPHEVLDAPLASVVGASQADAIIRTSSRFGDLRERNPLELEIEVGGRPVAFDAILHRETGALLLVELELATGPRPFSFPNTYLAVRGAVGQLNRATSLDELYEITARAVRELTGFDRVMVYRYDSEYNGEVVAEDKREDLNSFLGLHYPASDIPAQARALYEKNWIRLIDDVSYTPSPLVPIENPSTGRPTDLTHSTLRSVSPIHIEYLQNMGVGASMSISLLRDGKLWGLIACHHYSGPHLPPYGVRAAAEFLGSTLSLRLVDRVEDDELRARLESQTVLAKILAAIRNLEDTIESGLLGAPGLLDLIRADGLALNINGRIATCGAVPPSADLAEIRAWLVAQDEPVVATDCLTRDVPALSVDPAVASGLLALALRDGQYVIWFRSEAQRAVDWGGDPTNKAIAVREGDTVRLSPRKSFDRWREVVRLRSLPWTDVELADASALRQGMLETLYSRAEREVRLADTLQRSLLPELPRLSGWEVSAQYQPAAGGRIGGDWFDSFRLADGRLVLVLGDVAGHGVSSAGTMVQLRDALRAYLVDGSSPLEAINRLNRFSRQLLPDAFATLAVGCVDLHTGAVQAVLAGHPVPMIVGVDGAPVPAPVTTSPPIGVPGVAYDASDFTLDPGTTLVLFSDGLIERRDEDMTASLGVLTAEIRELADADRPISAATLFDTVGHGDTFDDTTVLVLRRG
jgi:light-regulated signal transduction histidine kinase (bacteriophytochrome)